MIKLQNKNIRVALYIVAAVYLAGVCALLAYRYFNQDTVLDRDFGELYETLGTTAAILYALTLVPGIIQRFRLFPKYNAVGIYYRRALGILTYITVVFHMTVLLGRHPLFTGEPLSMIEPIVALGMTALLLFTPLFVTSNNFSQRILKRNWKRIHRLTYLALIAVFAHFILVGEELFVLLYGMLIALEIASYAFKWLSKKDEVKEDSEARV